MLSIKLCIEQPKENGVLVIENDSSLLRGWAFDPDGVLSRIDFLLDGRVIATALPSISRPDVAAAFPDVPQALLSGWSVKIREDRVPGGAHLLTVSARGSRDGVEKHALLFKRRACLGQAEVRA